MPWTERQAALLQGMGLRPWSPPVPATAETVAPSPATAPSAAAPAAATQAMSPPVVPVTALTATTGALDWPALRKAVAGCRACSLCEGRRQTVFGVGHPRAHWLLVGEAPGEQEDVQGEPFVGAAGQLLDRMLAALGLTRAEDGPQPPERRVYIANALKCRPPRNRNPTAEEMVACAPHLQRQIELLQPRLILALGRFAVQALLRSDEPIGKLRGRVHRHAGVPLIVSYHPAYLLRSPLEKARAWEDLCLAADVADAGAAT
jgi:DNA polymerase